MPERSEKDIVNRADEIWNAPEGLRVARMHSVFRRKNCGDKVGNAAAQFAGAWS
jgi:hypothetical protein